VPEELGLDELLPEPYPLEPPEVPPELQGEVDEPLEEDPKLGLVEEEPEEPGQPVELHAPSTNTHARGTVHFSIRFSKGRE